MTLDKYVTRDEFKTMGDRIDRLHDTIHVFRNQLQEWMRGRL